MAATYGLHSLTEDEIKLVNCAECSQELLGRSTVELITSYSCGTNRKLLPESYRDTPEIGGRIQGRPYCQRCFNSEARSAPKPLVREHGKYRSLSSGVVGNSIHAVRDSF